MTRMALYSGILTHGHNHMMLRLEASMQRRFSHLKNIGIPGVIQP